MTTIPPVPSTPPVAPGAAPAAPAPVLAASAAPAPAAPVPARTSVVPDPSDSHPVMRAAKWMGAFVGIVGGLSAAIVGIWKVGQLIDDLNDAQEELASLQNSFDSYRDETRRRNEIQAEILNNLRIAVASIQAVAEYRLSTGSVPTPAVRVRRRTTERPAPAVSGTIPVVATVPRIVDHLESEPTMGTPAPPSLVLRGRPELSEIMETLPPLPEREIVLHDGSDVPEAALAHESETADVALERAEILQDSL